GLQTGFDDSTFQRFNEVTSCLTQPLPLLVERKFPSPPASSTFPIIRSFLSFAATSPGLIFGRRASASLMRPCRRPTVAGEKSHGLKCSQARPPSRSSIIGCPTTQSLRSKNI